MDWGCLIMANPLTKKNPMLSIWLSVANAWAGGRVLNIRYDD